MKTRGFTLLEVMIAMAILSGAITWTTVGVARTIKAENHAKLLSTATFLARSKMVDFEDDLYEKGFGEFEKETNGIFEDKGFSRFAWRIICDKVELPGNDQVQNAFTKVTEAKQALAGGDTSASSTANSAGSGGVSGTMGMMSSYYGIVKSVLEDGIRRATVHVEWLEGKTLQDVELVTYFTDPRRVDQAIQLNAAMLSGSGSGSGSGTTTTTPTTTTPVSGLGH